MDPSSSALLLNIFNIIGLAEDAISPRLVQTVHHSLLKSLLSSLVMINYIDFEVLKQICYLIFDI